MSTLVAERFHLDDTAIRDGHIWVDGFPVRNPDSRVAITASIVHKPPQKLAGELKLGAALAAFSPNVTGRVCADIGACTGGFTRALLDAGARKVYAVDTGYGQLLGSLRQDPRVVNLERVNLGALAIAEPIELMTIDVSYVSLATALPQLERLTFAPDAELVALVKPMFELGLAAPDEARRFEALAHAVNAIDQRWCVRNAIEYALTDEFLVWATRT